MRYGMMIELDQCIGCQACVTACKERWDSGPGAARDWVMEFEHGARGDDLGITFFPGLCNHCDDHPCTTDCPTGATWMNEDGIVVVDPDVCIGCGNCISTCPYGARHADARKGIVEKCNFCAPYLERGEQPACVETCLAECRHFGDLDDPAGELRTRIRERNAEPLTTDDVQIGPNVFYAPAREREQVLAAEVLRPARPTALTRAWQGYTRPAAQYGVPAIAAVAAAGGLVTNLIARRERVRETEHAAGPTQQPDTLPRHRLGMRLLHWFNLLSWLLLLLSGTALMIAPSFALFGDALPTAVAQLVGGKASLLKLHVAWGLLWAALIVSAFLYHKRGGIEALREIRPTRDDLRWMMRKPQVMLGRLGPQDLPPQDKYNAGQKAFAASALLGTTLIIATGVIMSFHLGSPEIIRAAILVHKLAIMLALVGLAVHVTMAAIIADERPALRSMVTGKVATEHAAAHSAKWVAEVAARGQQTAERENES